MNFHNHALLLGLIESLISHSLPSDRMHVHSALFLLSGSHPEIVSFGFFYSNGPCSPEVNTELQRMNTYDAVVLLPVPGVGVMLQPGPKAEWLKEKHPLSDHERGAMDFISNFIASTALSDGEHDPIKLDRLATILWIRQRLDIQEADAAIKLLNSLKPQAPAVADKTARQEVRSVTELVERAREATSEKLRPGSSAA